MSAAPEHVTGPEQPAEQELTLEQLEADIAAAEDLHQSLSARLDAIARD